jgi:APA family basic amino acid/polyamine antiporter
MAQLARKLGRFDYFALGCGSIIGVGWLVVMNDWLQRGGPLGAILGFAIGGAALLPVGYVYGRLVMAFPDAAGEVAYTARVFPEKLSFATGWMVLLPYLSACPWCAIAIGRMAVYMFPGLESHQAYRIGTHPIYLPLLILGLLLTGLVTSVNYQGVRLSATFQSVAMAGFLLLFVVFSYIGITHGRLHNFSPPFNGPPFLAVLLVLQIVPYFMTGFESIGKASEESREDFRPRDYLVATLLSIVVGALFYDSVIAVVAFAAPWTSLMNERYATILALQQAVGGRAIVNIVLVAALISLFKVLNGAFVASTRLLFAMSKRGLISSHIGKVHPVNRTPAAAVLLVGAITFAAVFFGDSILIPMIEVGALGSAFGWTMASAAYFRLNSNAFQGRNAMIAHTRKARLIERIVSAVGLIVGGILILMKVLSFLPGHLTFYEYVGLVLWLALGASLYRHQAVTGLNSARSSTL